MNARSRSRGSATLPLLVVVALQAFAASAGVTTAESEGVRATLYAPDWVWKGQNLNFLVVFENSSGLPLTSKVDLHVANADLDEFGAMPRAAESLRLDSGEQTRLGIANVPTSNATIDRPYQFVVTATNASSAGPSFQLELPAEVIVIRGAVVAEGIWAAILPAAVAAAWCVVLALYFRRHAARGAWKTPSAPVLGP